MILPHLRRVALPLLAVAATAAALSAAPSPVDVKTGTVKDRKGFIPHRKYAPLPGKVVGVLVADVRAMMGQEGRSSFADAMGLSVGGNSYRWIYVPVTERPNITNFTVPTGQNGNSRRTYPMLSMARPETTAAWGVNAPYALVEVEVNDGEGSPAGETFVATRVKRLDGGPGYSLRLPDVVADLRKRYARSVADRQKKIDEALAEVQKNVLKGRKVTGPRQTEEMLYLTWLPETQRLRVHLRSKLTDGAYQFATIGGGRPFPLPVPPQPQPPARGPALQAAQPARPPVRRPPFRPPIQVRYGVTFGVEYGAAYEVDKTGKLVTTLELTPETFSSETPPPAGVPLGGPNVPLPPGGGPAPGPRDSPAQPGPGLDR